MKDVYTPKERIFGPPKFHGRDAEILAGFCKLIFLGLPLLAVTLSGLGMFVMVLAALVKWSAMVIFG